MKKVMLCVCVLTASLSSKSTLAQDWNRIGSTNGVSVFSKCKQEARDQTRTELQFTNNNSYDVEIKYTPVFTCYGGGVEKSYETRKYLKAGQTQSGQWAGLIWYPCKSTCPTYIELKNIIVTKQ